MPLIRIAKTLFVIILFETLAVEGSLIMPYWRKKFVLDIVALLIMGMVAICLWLFGQTLTTIIPLIYPDGPITRTTIEQASVLPNPIEIKITGLSRFRQTLQKTVDDFATSEPNDYGIYVEHLDSSIFASHNQEKQFITASLYKPFAVLEVLKMVDSGAVSLDQPILDGLSVSECIWMTITYSDNPCGRALRTLSDLPNNTQVLARDGYLNTTMYGDYPVSTAEDIATLFEHLYYQDLLGQSSNELFLDALKNQLVNDRLPLGISPDTTISHKTGDLEGAAHDGGIVFSPRGDYIIIVLSGPDYSGRTLAERYQKFADFISSIEEVMINNADFLSDL